MKMVSRSLYAAYQLKRHPESHIVQKLDYCDLLDVALFFEISASQKFLKIQSTEKWVYYVILEIIFHSL
jgi:hypothetical protein